MNRKGRIEARVAEALAPTEIDVIDESDRHAGHAGSRPGGETHYRLRVVSARFSGLNRVARHRLVNETLKEEFSDGLHALAIEARAPGEA
jgi:BolA family transcriptional regulator, general stress-responsive regulator